MLDGQTQKLPIPWALKERLGFFRALAETIRLVLFRPGEFFEDLDVEGPLWLPISFYFIVFVIVMAISFIWDMMFKGADALPVLQPINILFYFLMAPFFGIIALCLGSAVLHLFVLLFKGTGGFKGTFNVIAYNVSTGLFSIIPFVGGLIGIVWAVVVGVIGFKKVHNLSTAKAVIAYCALPFIAIVIALAVAIAVPNLQKMP